MLILSALVFAMSPQLQASRVATEKDIDRAFAAAKDHRKCVVEQTVTIGKSNSEPADNVLTAAHYQCRDFAIRLNSILERFYLSGFFNRFNAKTDQQAIAKLLVARNAPEK